MKSTIIFATLIICSLALIAFGLFSLADYSANKRFENRCLAEQPRVLIAGKISHQYGVFHSGPNEYYLYYKGKTRKAHEECKARVAVTESEYERNMYGEK